MHAPPFGTVRTSGYSPVGDTVPSFLPEPLDRESLEYVNDQLEREQAERARRSRLSGFVFALAIGAFVEQWQDRPVGKIVRTIPVLGGKRFFAVGAAPVHVGHIVVILQTCTCPVNPGCIS